jgi:uncharacterized protein (TIGR02444 family)
MRLWDWAIQAYARPGVAPACLALQDAHGQNVCLLLWAAWARTDDAELIDRAADLARRWERLAVGPIRLVRAALKDPVAGVPDAARLKFREDVKAAELQAERLLLDSLEALGGNSDTEPLAALRAAAAAWGNAAAVPAHALAALADALR